MVATFVWLSDKRILSKAKDLAIVARTEGCVAGLSRRFDRKLFASDVRRGGLVSPAGEG